MEIRLHGRGGQGGVTCAKILAAAYARLGKSVQAFGDYAGERSGAPVRAYARVGDGPITSRNKVYAPDHLVVLDPTLLGAQIVAGLARGGTLLVNSPEPPEAYAERFGAFRIATVDATAIARRHHIGSRSVVIVNTTIAGAFARLLDLPLDELAAAYGALHVGSDIVAAREAHAAVRVREPDAGAVAFLGERLADGPWAAGAAGATAAVIDLVDHVEGPPPGLKTGSWRTLMPRYVAGLAPCNAACPAGNDVVGFVQALARGDEPRAAAILARTTPLPGVCGRVCPAFCMQRCNRAGYDGAVSIRALERYVADRAGLPRPAVATPSQVRRVAVVGGGPAGLAAAYALAAAGHRAVIFEAERELGGVLRTGIPAFRLPPEVVRREIARILDLGVEARTGAPVQAARLAELAEQYDGVVLATGLQRLSGLDAPGAALAGVEQGIRFLHRVNLEGGAKLGGHVVVLGGGNTAMDCARTALRLGAEKVTVAYRRTRQEMPAIAEEIDEAAAEGVELLYQRAPLAFRGGASVEAVELAEVEMGAPDESGRRRPVVTERTSSLRCNAVLLALGQSADAAVLPAGWSIEAGRIVAAGKPLAVFAAGDLGTAAGTVTHAIGDGRRAARSLLLALGEQAALRPEAQPLPPEAIRAERFAHVAPARQRHEPAAERRGHFAEVVAGLDDAGEARRCFACGHCTSCDTCLVYCPEALIGRVAGGGYAVNYDYCKGCGLCVAECPRSALEMVAEAK
ncbi:MAG: 2-oxoacid:acceptor oxidoreductase family protein [Deltaproteobacteria bacterium]|nr:2-oxoacid:acceptor oxidoreductase family protein [Deltaproteobacteria bacterium]